MGTDIHGVFQRYDQDRAQWRDVSSNYDQDRHYQLFAVLADVRNGIGFAGTATGEAVQPIAERRGLPVDFEIRDGYMHPLTELAHIDPSRQIYREAGEALEVWMGDHSYSWLSSV